MSEKHTPQTPEQASSPERKALSRELVPEFTEIAEITATTANHLVQTDEESGIRRNREEAARQLDQAIRNALSTEQAPNRYELEGLLGDLRRSHNGLHAAKEYMPSGQSAKGLADSVAISRENNANRAQAYFRNEEIENDPAIRPTEVALQAQLDIANTLEDVSPLLNRLDAEDEDVSGALRLVDNALMDLNGYDEDMIHSAYRRTQDLLMALESSDRARQGMDKGARDLQEHVQILRSATEALGAML